MITQAQADALINSIYNILMSNPDMGLGNMSEAREAAEQLVTDWIKSEKITLN